jgi:diguanylate cyclase (GGDEF)-like protein
MGYRTLRAVDPVTGHGNARCWSRRAALVQCDAYWRREPVALLAVDIDQFARINDEYGHPAGDDVLRSVGGLLRRATRPADLVCRCVADEFLVLAPGRDADAALELAGRIRDHARLLITTAMASADWFVTITDVTVSVGIAVGHDLATNDLLSRARGALEHIKGYGNDLICLADPGAAADRSLTRQALSATTCRLG